MDPQALQQTFDLALQHHQAARLQEAERLYRQILSQHPTHAEAIHLLGVVALQVGRNDVAVDLIRRALVLNPILVEAYNNLGNALKGTGQLDEAIAAYRQAIALRPGYTDAYFNLGNALKDKGQLDEAIASLRQAIALRPNFADVHNNLGIALINKGELNEAIAAFRQAILHNPNLAPAHSNLGNVLKEKGELNEAIEAFRQAIALLPNYFEAHSNLSIALTEKGDLNEAIAACRRAIALNPNFAEAHYNLGNALKDRGELDRAIAAYTQAIALRPDNAGAHNNMSMALLARGDFPQGWKEYEWRWKCPDFPAASRTFTQPQWDGSPPEGRKLLLRTEQGFGDAIQFIRYLPMVAERGGRIIIECPAELQRLFQTSFDKCQFVLPSQPPPAFDFQSPLLSLPRVFGTTLDNLPKNIPYLKADAEKTRTWQHRLAARSPALNVGLVWAGRPTHKNDRNRSIKLANLASLGQIPGVRFISLQKDDAANECKTPPAGMDLVDWTVDLKDFADTAALIANLDLVISVDTAVVHLAGAMNKPVWTLLPYAPDWRWMREREDSSWYPTMRLFRQPSIGDWNSVIARVTDALSIWVKTNRG